MRDERDMSRVLLFVRRMVSTPRFPDGDDRPKCIGPAPHDARSAEGGLHPSLLTNRQAGLVLSADRWWLVECENAEAGRGTIYAVLRSAPVNEPRGFKLGRILASGGRT